MNGRPQPSSLRVVTQYGRSAASARVRAYNWLDQLNLDAEIFDYMGTSSFGLRNLVRSPHGILHAELRLRVRSRRPNDVVFIQRGASPWSHGGIETRLLQGARWGVYDFDDALHLDVRSGLYGRLVARSHVAQRAVSAANQVIAGNAYLADWASHHNKQVDVIPSCVDPNEYLVKTNYAISDPPRLGWIGSPSSEDFLFDLAPALLEVNRRYGAILLVISAGSKDLGPLAHMTERLEWRPGIEHEMATMMDIGLMPLPDTPYARGKCAYKMLQYAAAGIPSIASPVGVNSTIGQALGFALPRASTDWIDAIDALILGSEAHRCSIGRSAVSAAQDNYSYQAWRDRWKDLVLRSMT